MACHAEPTTALLYAVALVEAEAAHAHSTASVWERCGNAVQAAVSHEMGDMCAAMAAELRRMAGIEKERATLRKSCPKCQRAMR